VSVFHNTDTVLYEINTTFKRWLRFKSLLLQPSAETDDLSFSVVDFYELFYTMYEVFFFFTYAVNQHPRENTTIYQY